MSVGEIGERVREALRVVDGRPTQAALAADVGMTPDALSRALSGSRGFSAIELARVADRLGADVHWLITGEPDPLAVRFVARHQYDHASRSYSVDHGADDQTVLDGVHLAYRQAQTWLPSASPRLPTTAVAMRDALGSDFVRAFADTVEQRLGVDVVRVPGLSTDYSFVIANRPVVLLSAQPTWFRSNFSLAHELAHLALGHPGAVESADGQHERDANAFASALLLPADLVRGIDWVTQSDADVARFLWDTGVSTAALKNRLRSLGQPIPACLNDSPPQATLSFLRRNTAEIPHLTVPNTNIVEIDPVTRRFQQAAERRIPDALASALVTGITEGHLNTGTLSWLMGTRPEEAEEQEPDPEPDLNDLMGKLGVQPAP